MNDVLVPRPRWSKMSSAHRQMCQHCMQLKERRSVIFPFFLTAAAFSVGRSRICESV